MTSASQELRVVLLTDAAGEAVPVLDTVRRARGDRLVGVLTSPGPHKRRGASVYPDVVKATPASVDVIVSNHPQRWAAMLAPLRPDVLISTDFLWRIPEDVVSLPRVGAFNAHGGLLPRGRGANPVGWAFRNDEGQIGWTAHRIRPELDAGPILAQAAISYGDEDDYATLFPRWAQLIPAVWQQALDRLLAGDPGEPQSEADAYVADQFEPEWRLIDWSRPARVVHNQVRSWIGRRGTPSGATGEIDGRQMLVTKTRLVDEPESGSPPGTLLRRDGDTLLIQCGDRPLQILEWQPVEAADTRLTNGV